MPQSLVKNYIHIIFSTKYREHLINQKDHHNNITFQNEYRAILKRYQVEYDERYVWD